MRKILVFQHVAREPLGTLNPLFKSHGFRIRYVNFERHPDLRPSLDGYHGLVVLGGPMNVDEVERYPHLAWEVKKIREAMEKEIPVLGICLGAQLMAKALGAKVVKSPQKEMGWHDIHLTKEGRDDPFFSSFQPTEKIFQWHEDTFPLPKGAVLLAGSPLCETQAFRFGKSAYALQFHLEVDEPLIQRWFAEGPVEGKETILKETHQYIHRLKTLSTHGFGAFIKLFGVEKKFRRLASR